MSVIQTDKVPVILLIDNTDIVGQELWCHRRQGRLFPRRNRRSSAHDGILQVEILELGSTACVLGTAGIISKMQGKLWWQRLLTVTPPVICTFAPILSCKAVFLFLEEYPVNEAQAHLGDLTHPLGLSYPLPHLPKGDITQHLPLLHTLDSTSWTPYTQSMLEVTKILFPFQGQHGQCGNVVSSTIYSKPSPVVLHVLQKLAGEN